MPLMPRVLIELAKVAMRVTRPAFPRIIKVLAIFLRALWLTIISASRVVYPVPEKHDRDWNLACDHDIPVRLNATALMRTTMKEMKIAMIKSKRFME